MTFVLHLPEEGDWLLGRYPRQTWSEQAERKSSALEHLC